MHLFSCFWIFSLLAFANGFNLTLLGNFSISYPGFTTLYPNISSNGTTYDLIISTFDPIPFTKDSVYIVRNVGRFVKNVRTIKPEVIADSLTWPNEAAGIPGLRT